MDIPLINLDGDQDADPDKEVKEIETRKVVINQVGYLPDDKKIAYIKDYDGKFEVINIENGKTIFTGETEIEKQDDMSGDTIYYGDFSTVTKEGNYKVVIPDANEESVEFEINKEIYKDVYKSLIDMYDAHRCGIDLGEDVLGKWNHLACHTEEATIYNSNEKKDVTGGWHDAGDYGRYVVPGAKSVADLMLSFDIIGDKSNTLVNDNKLKYPAILSKVKYELDWMLKMQDNKTGGVYHKVTSLSFAGEVQPDKATDDLFLFNISSPATADFAAVMAMASRVYKPYDTNFSNNCLDASKKAWEWLEKNSRLVRFTNPKQVITGEYGDDNDYDERYWAAAELARTTGDNKYISYIKDKFMDNMAGLGWQEVADYGTFAYLFSDVSKLDSSMFTIDLRENIIKRADNLVKMSEEDGYNITLDYYRWGSNMDVMNNAMFLILANEIKENNIYVEVAKKHVDYLLGCNTLGISYITGIGDNYASNPHHRPSIAVGETIKGMVVGGPNQDLEDIYAKRILEGRPPAKCYIDDVSSYSTNEVTIYWNSPAVFVVSYFIE